MPHGTSKVTQQDTAAVRPGMKKKSLGFRRIKEKAINTEKARVTRRKEGLIQDQRKSILRHDDSWQRPWCCCSVWLVLCCCGKLYALFEFSSLLTILLILRNGAMVMGQRFLNVTCRNGLSESSTEVSLMRASHGSHCSLKSCVKVPSIFEISLVSLN